MTEYILLYAKSSAIITSNLSMYADIQNINTFKIEYHSYPTQITTNSMEYGIHNIMTTLSKIGERSDLFHILQNILDSNLFIDKTRRMIQQTSDLVTSYIKYQPIYQMLTTETLPPAGLNVSNMTTFEYLRENPNILKPNSRILIVTHNDTSIKKVLNLITSKLNVTYQVLSIGPQCSLDSELVDKFDLIITTETYLYLKGKWGITEYIYHYRLLYYLLIILKYLKPMGTAILEMAFGYTNVTKQMIYLLATMFDYSFIIKSEYARKYTPYSNIVLSKYNSTKISSKLETSIINEITLALSKMTRCGEETQLPNDRPERSIFVDLDKWDATKDITDSFITNLFNYHTAPSIQFEEAYDNYIYDLNKMLLNKINQILAFMELWQSYSKDKAYITEILKFATNIKIFAYVKFCKKYKLALPNEVLQQYRKITADPEYISRTYFPFRPHIKYTSLKITPEGYYSISRPFIGNEIIRIMQDILSKDAMLKYTITDVCGGNGGDSINFCTYYKFTNIIESNPLHCKVIKHNLKVYELDNYQMYCNLYDEVYDKIIQDVIYIDPPWGGPKIKNMTTVNIKLGSINIHQLVNHLATTFPTLLYIILKLPPNFDLIQYNRYIDKKIKVSVYNIYDSIMLIVNQIHV